MSQIPNDAFDEKQTVSRQLAAQEQIETAIEMMRRRRYACAITPALAAESQIPATGVPNVMSALKDRFSTLQIDNFNFIRNWLKHDKEPETVTLYEFKVVLSLLRAIEVHANLSDDQL